MPPSRHSSSHHSSSHRSSHSSSHHSSSRSYSRSSHSSSHSSYSGSSSYSRSTTPVIHNRIRKNQPTGYQGGSTNISRYRLRNHDYDYFPVSWTAPDGKYYEEGYYDENGQHYKNIFVPGESLMLSCEYCGNKMLYSCKEGELPTCSKCGAQFKIDVTDQKETVSYGGQTASSKNAAQHVIIGLAVGLMILLFVSCSFGLILEGMIASDDDGRTAGSSRNSVYVEEIGRTCYLDGEDWYDSKTKCWFWFNDEAKPYQWQYWYEDISSDYGDYGWMEYNMDEDTWYIEVRDGEWVQLPYTYDTSKLWHFTDEYTDPF